MRRPEPRSFGCATNGAIIEKTYGSDKIPIPLLTSPLKGETNSDSLPLQGEGQGEGGVDRMSIQLWPDS